MKHVIKFAVVVLLLVATPGFVNAQKIAHINRDSLLRIMPDYTIIKDSLSSHQLALEKILYNMEVQFGLKQRERDSLEGKRSPLILSLMDKELQDMQQNYMAFSQAADQELLDLQVSLLTPLFKKVDDAIAAEAKVGGYSYVLDSSEGRGVLFSKPEDDLFNKVCLRLKVTPPKPAPAPAPGAPAPAPNK